MAACEPATLDSALRKRRKVNERECIVFGKGNKERVVYFNARAKIHLQQYLKSRKDKNQALFVTLDRPHERLQISGPCLAWATTSG